MKRVAGLFVRATFVGLAIIMLSAFAAFLYFDYVRNTDGPNTKDAYFYVHPGAQPSELAISLEKGGYISDSQHYIWMHYWQRLSFTDEYLPKVGEYKIPAKASLNSIRDIFHMGKAIQRRLTFPEGLTTAAILSIIDNATGLLGNVPEGIEEGSLFPDTYFYIYGMQKTELVARMQAKMELELAEAWALRADSLPYKLPVEAHIMASIIEKETGRSGERALVASVFVNRLKRNMRLQSDPTVIYGVEATDKVNYEITKADLKANNPFNTYRIKGLPPTPIASPGRAALDAALNPKTSDYLYFVADGEGGHFFAKTLDEHNKNVRKYRARNSKAN